MTHTLHRRGSEDSLSRDIIFLIMPSKDINHVGSHVPLKRFFQIALEAGAVKMGDCRSGNEYYQGSLDNVINNVQDRAVIHAVFNDREKAIGMMRRLKEADSAFPSSSAAYWVWSTAAASRPGCSVTQWSTR